MRILGIDPGLTQTGFGIIHAGNSDPTLVDFGIIKPPGSDNPLAQRLKSIYRDIVQIVQDYKPTIMAVEDVFYGKNVKSTLLLGHARGAALLAGAEFDLPIYEYSARKIKQAVTGNGNAHKNQVQYMVKARLKMKFAPEPLDASDALAIAICHYQQIIIET